MRTFVILVACVGILAFGGKAGAASDITPEALMGDYSLDSFVISNGYGTYPSSGFSRYSGRASATTKGIVLDFSGYQSSIGSIAYYSCGFYSITSSNRMSVSITGGTTTSVTVSQSDGLLTTRWSEYIDGVYTTITCNWRKTKTYYTSQSASGEERRVVVIPMF